jgi:hypothetical protein
MFEFTYELYGEKLKGFADYFVSQQTGKFIVNLHHGYIVIGPMHKMKKNTRIIWIQFPTYRFKKQSDEMIQALGEGIIAGGFLVY